MLCPRCHSDMRDVTESWHTFAEAEGAEYLSSYVTIWLCERCHLVAGSSDEDLEWVMEREEARSEE